MKIVGINAVSYGSTGTIMRNIAEVARKNGIEYHTFSKSVKGENPQYPYHHYISGYRATQLSARLSSYTGFEGVYNFFATYKLIRFLKKIKPDIIHLHNLHGWYLNFPMLFRYIKKNNISVVWTLHDCWALTAKCPGFQMVSCDKWRSECKKCPQLSFYPQQKTDCTNLMFKLKKSWFNGVKNMTIITPSNWLAGLVRQSYLKEYNVKTILNGINLSFFEPTESVFRKSMKIGSDKFILLGVAFDWGYRKGLDVFIELSKRLDDSKYKIVLVGTDENVDKMLPANIISIHRTSNQNELAEIYTAADLFVNPTREEVFGLVNVEANACGTPVVTFNTGGSPECISEKSGSVVRYNDIDAMEKEIIRICEENIYSSEDCIESAKSYNIDDKIKEYVDEYLNF